MFTEFARNLQSKISNPAGTIKSVVDLFGPFFGNVTETEEGRNIQLGDPATSDVAGDLTGITALQEVLRGDVGVGNVLDLAGVALDMGIPGPPVMPFLAGLGFFQSAKRLATKIPDKETLGAVTEHTRDIADQLRVLGHTGTDIAPTSILGTEGTLKRGIASSAEGSPIKRVTIDIPKGEGTPEGLFVSANRDFETPGEITVPSFFSSEGPGSAPTAIGARGVAQIRDILTKEFPGARTLKANRTTGARHGKAANLESQVQDVIDESYIDAPSNFSLDITKRGERALQQSNPFLDFLTTVFANSGGADSVSSPLAIVDELQKLLLSRF